MKQITISNDMITRFNGQIPVNEDLEFKLNHGTNKITVYVYASRTFKEDLLLFYNEVSLRKPLSTEDVNEIDAFDPMFCRLSK